MFEERRKGLRLGITVVKEFPNHVTGNTERELGRQVKRQIQRLEREMDPPASKPDPSVAGATS
jgi:hypothetical protein